MSASGQDELRWELPGRGRALFTARRRGNLSSVGGEGAEHGQQAREDLLAELGVEAIARGYQVHGRTVRRVHRRPTGSAAPQFGLDDADGQATALDAVATMILAADCVPAVIGGPEAVAAVHAGWRGLATGVLEEGVLAVRELGGTGAITAVVGPCARGCCYEVGEEVHAALGGRHRTGRRVDLAAIACERLLASGVAEVKDTGICTICDERFFSHRREGARAGRHAALAWLS